MSNKKFSGKLRDAQVTENLNKIFDVWEEVHDCVICGIKFKGFGNNPEPVKSLQEGRCCDSCDDKVVIPNRLLNW